MFGPLLALVGIAIFAVILRWAFNRGGSLIEKPVTPGKPTDYGLLTSVAQPANYIEAEIIRRTLADAGIQATIASTQDGAHIMVWPKDAQRARNVIKKN